MTVNEIWKRHEERRERKLECYGTYHRLEQEYVYDIILDMKSGEFVEQTAKKKNYIEELNIFQGYIINRQKESPGRYESRFKETERYHRVALQKSSFDAIVEFCEKRGMNLREIEFVRIKIRLYGKRKTARAIVSDIQEISEGKYRELEEEVRNRIRNGFRNKFRNDKNRTRNENPTRNEEIVYNKASEQIKGNEEEKELYLEEEDIDDYNYRQKRKESITI